MDCSQTFNLVELDCKNKSYSRLLVSAQEHHTRNSVLFEYQALQHHDKINRNKSRSHSSRELNHNLDIAGVIHCFLANTRTTHRTLVK